MKYLVTGGAGFIGTHFSEHLLARGDEVIILDNLSRRGTKENLQYIQEHFPQCAYVHADVRSDIAQMNELADGVDVIYHLAGQVAVTTSVHNPREDFEINALGTFNVLEAARAAKKPPIVVYASTNKVYGGMEGIKITEGKERYQYTDFPNGIPETQLLDFHSPYGCSKGAADQYVRDYARIYNVPTVVMRQSCIYGTRQFGIEDQGWVAWFTIASALNRPITIYGNGKQVRDVLYVDDLFSAWDAVTAQISKTAGRIYNVGGGSEYSLSLLELITLLEKLQKNTIPYEMSDWRPGDQPVYISDIAKLTKDTGWTPQVSVEQGVAKLHNWVEKNTSLLESVLNF